jgi:hypothetical protein
MNAMVDIVMGLTREFISHRNDELIIPNWMFNPDEERNIEQRMDALNNLAHQAIHTSYRLRESRDNGDYSGEELIPSWLYQDAPRQNWLYQDTPQQNTERIHFQHIRTSGRIIQLSNGIPPYNQVDDVIIHRSIFPFKTKFDPEPFKQSKTIEKHIDKNRNTECPITYDDIKFGDAYMTCSDCKYNFSETAIMKHLNEKQTCPMCRCNWKDTCKYINKVIIPDELMAKNIIKKLPSIENACKKDFTKKCNILGEMKSSRYNKRWNYGK